MRQQTAPVRDSFRTSVRSATPSRRVGGRSPVTVVQVHPEVWQTALGLARGEVRRLQVLDSTAVLVLNGWAR